MSNEEWGLLSSTPNTSFAKIATTDGSACWTEKTKEPESPGRDWRLIVQCADQGASSGIGRAGRRALTPSLDLIYDEVLIFNSEKNWFPNNLTWSIISCLSSFETFWDNNRARLFRSWWKNYLTTIWDYIWAIILISYRKKTFELINTAGKLELRLAFLMTSEEMLNTAAKSLGNYLINTACFNND